MIPGSWLGLANGLSRQEIRGREEKRSGYDPGDLPVKSP